MNDVGEKSYEPLITRVTYLSKGDFEEEIIDIHTYILEHKSEMEVRQCYKIFCNRDLNTERVQVMFSSLFRSEKNFIQI